MNCNTFRNKLSDYMENNLYNDMEEAMEEHRKNCKHCHDLYEEELKIENMFKDALKIEPSMFNSSRADIIKAIDKNKYSRGRLSKIKYHFFKNNKKYIASVAAALFILLITPNLSKEFLGANMNKMNKGITPRSQFQKEVKTEDTSKSKQITKDGEVLKTIELVENRSEYVPEFKKQQVLADIEPQFGTAWKESPSKKLMASIDGKGPEAIEEGIADILIKNQEQKKAWKFSIINENNKQNTPMSLEWADDDNLFIIVGFGYGRVSLGGNVYLLNIDTMKTSLIYETRNQKEQVKNLANKENVIELNLVIYADDSMNKFHEESRIIKYEDVTKKESEDISTIYNFSKNLNDKLYDKAVSSLGQGLQESYMDVFGDLKGIKAMDIKRIIDITDTSFVKQNDYYSFKIYCVEANYTIDSTINTTLKSANYYNRFVVAQKEKDSPWEIVQISVPPQN